MGYSVGVAGGLRPSTCVATSDDSCLRLPRPVRALFGSIVTQL